MNISNGSRQHFLVVSDPNILIPILRERHPKSCFFQNQVVSYPHFRNDIKFYTLGPSLDADTWIISTYMRQDLGQTISISAPTDIVNGDKPISVDVIESFSQSSHIINWDKNDNITFVPMEEPVYQMIFDMCSREKGKVVEVHPCILYCMQIESALNISINSMPNVTIRRLDSDKDVDFILSTWPYTSQGSDVETAKCIKANASAGVFTDGQCVSGLYTSGYGLLTALYTRRQYRNRGFGKLTMKYVFKELAKDGCIPCWAAERRNPSSMGLSQSLGVEQVSFVNFICVKKLVVDYD